MITKILVPIDGSDYSSKVLDYALDIAEKYSADVKLITVTQPIVVTGSMFMTKPMLSSANTTIYIKEIEAAHQKMLDEAFKIAKNSYPELNISKELINGRPADKIVEKANVENFDLIVMGSRGSGGMKEFFLGSVSNRVADEVHCPIFLIK
jgi:nucleotide-binding universal stress UspA family protein